jgi:cysteinyl-tRNA synthetase
MEKLKELNIDSSTTDFPKASDNISEQINLIKTLEEKGFHIHNIRRSIF